MVADGGRSEAPRGRDVAGRGREGVAGAGEAVVRGGDGAAEPLSFCRAHGATDGARRRRFRDGTSHYDPPSGTLLSIFDPSQYVVAMVADGAAAGRAAARANHAS